MVNGLTGKGRPLLNPLQGFRGGKRASRLPYHCHEELLQELCRRAKVCRFDELNSPLSLAFVFARSYCRVDEDVGVEERLNGHANPHGSTPFCRVAPQIEPPPPPPP